MSGALIDYILVSSNQSPIRNTMDTPLVLRSQRRVYT